MAGECSDRLGNAGLVSSGDAISCCMKSLEVEVIKRANNIDAQRRVTARRMYARHTTGELSNSLRTLEWVHYTRTHGRLHFIKFVINDSSQLRF
jgi:hypothetical protein